MQLFCATDARTTISYLEMSLFALDTLRLFIIALHIAGGKPKIPIYYLSRQWEMTLDVLVGENREFSSSFHFRKPILPNQIGLWGRLQQSKKEGKKVGYKENIEVYLNKAKALFCLQQRRWQENKTECVLWYPLVTSSSVDPSLVKTTLCVCETECLGLQLPRKLNINCPVCSSC